MNSGHSQLDIAQLTLVRLGVESLGEPTVYLHADSYICRAEGFDPRARVELHSNGRSLTARVNIVHGDWLRLNEAGLSETAWQLLQAQEGAPVTVAHAEPTTSLSYIRHKIYGHRWNREQINTIVHDVVAHRLSDVELTAFLVAGAGGRMHLDEIRDLTVAMVDAGARIEWGRSPVLDKHSLGGLPGNRTTMVLVPIVAAAGLMIPKTSSRAITSPAGTADAMETLAPVALDLAAMRRVVEREGGCIVWGGSMTLSPADDALIRIERILDLDAPGQMVASVLSKKAAAGSTHVVIDISVGPTAKVRTHEAARQLQALLQDTAAAVGLEVHVVFSDGRQPVGRGLGPALEARDVLAVLENAPGAPLDLREKSLFLAGQLLEMAEVVPVGQGTARAAAILDSGAAYNKFLAICEAQGGLRTPPQAPHTRPVLAARAGVVQRIDNRRLAMVAKLAGAPNDRSAGLELHKQLGATVAVGEPLFTVHAETVGELDYALRYAQANGDIVVIEEA